LTSQALLDILKKQHSPVLATPSEKGDRNSLEDMRTQLEVLKQQVRKAESRPGWISYSVILPSLPRIAPGRLAM